MPTPDIAWAYPLLLKTHVSLVAGSAGLFALRGLGGLLGQTWPMRSGWRHLSVAIDTALLAAGASLWWLLQLNPLHAPWLGTKLALLLVYIALGSMALKRARSPRSRALFLLAALLCLAFMASVALARHPLGWWAP
ncbi:SirB2 family protein [Hydrogenophaga sp.]|uniref:SirB2 family protein n=1 Tax=Hydrogenophaga sp. TaxID=1904254 RepID=UPI0027318AC3|nr:SirB2 family protein [Hydrogenophaga sp.]MDP2018196.1 SirB2 family protein [Hydrogenophaga sp.]MDP3164749.1 SirB2 family protein [Hydrogenophaga sp.]MDP3809363.1 SirB2 family protein [Hydrogenophaga sp.]